MTVHLTPNTMI